MVQNIIFQIDAVLLNVQFFKGLSCTTVFNIDNNTNMISEASLKTGVMMQKIQLCITEIN